MKARAEISAAKPGVLAALQIPEMALTVNRCSVEQRVFILVAANDLVGVYVPAGIERDHYRCIGGQVLQAVHQVSHAENLVFWAFAVAQIVPARPRASPGWHQVRVGMKNCGVCLVPDLAQGGLFLRRGVCKQLQRLIGMAGEYDMVVVLAAAIRCNDRLDIAVTLHPNDRLISVYAAGERGRQAPDIFAASATDRSPFRPVVELHQPVVVEELQKRECRESQHLFHGTRPDRRAHRHQVVVNEGVAVPVDTQKISERNTFQRAVPYELRCLAIKSPEIPDHAQKARPDQISRLRQQAQQICPGVLERTVIQRR